MSGSNTRKRSREQDQTSDSELENSTETITESESESTESELDSVYTPKCSTRSIRRNMQRLNYLKGKARCAHSISCTLKASFKENQPGPSTEASDEHLQHVCKHCDPVLTKYADTFKGLIMQGTKLKKRKKINPHPKRPDFAHYRDLNKQNEWLRSNVFDTMGNYLFCCKCIHIALGISYKRLAHQRSVKRSQYAEPLRRMTKGDVIENRLSQFVVMPPDCDQSFSVWWQKVATTDEINVRYPHHRHGLAGKPSNFSKKEAKAAFLEFVDLNSQPNGRKAESHCATSYLLPKFRTIQTPKVGVRCYQERLAQSLVGEFNRAQRESGGVTISNYSGSEWFRKQRPKHGIYPHKKDYCDTCSKIKHNIESKRMSLTRFMQSGSSTEQTQQLESDIIELEAELQAHREAAMKSHEYYNDSKLQCNTQWKEIQRLKEKERTKEEESELMKLQHLFTLVLSADYQMSKLVPYWGLSPQPGST